MHFEVESPGNDFSLCIQFIRGKCDLFTPEPLYRRNVFIQMVFIFDDK